MTSTPPNDKGRTALHYSAFYGHPRIAWAMVFEALENGQHADLDARDEQGRSVLHACADAERASDVAGTLIHWGADPSAKDNEGLSAEAYARNKGVERLAQAIAYAAATRRRGNIGGASAIGSARGSRAAPILRSPMRELCVFQDVYTVCYTANCGSQI